jgi:hypothetical protein
MTTAKRIVCVGRIVGLSVSSKRYENVKKDSVSSLVGC